MSFIVDGMRQNSEIHLIEILRVNHLHVRAHLKNLNKISFDNFKNVGVNSKVGFRHLLTSTGRSEQGHFVVKVRSDTCILLPWHDVARRRFFFVKDLNDSRG